MSPNTQLIQLEADLSLHITNVVPASLCETLIRQYEDSVSDESNVDTTEAIIAECAPWLAKGPIKNLLEAYFHDGYQIFCSVFDALGADDHTYLSTTWHFDYGIKRSLKLFIYLNSVEEHKGNTLIIDQHRTNLLREAGALPLEMEKRKEDLSTEMQALGMSDKTLGYDLKAGDALLFSPFLLAHRCLLPIQGHKRYTVCFTLTQILS